MKKKTKNNLTVHVVLDRSGSMQSIKDDTIGAFNEYVTTLAKDAPKSRLSLTIFDSQAIDTIVNDKPIGEVEKLTADTYQPRGGTPLYDAIGKTATLLTEADGKNKALVILTDGQENASNEYTLDAIKKLLTEKQEKDNWLVIYLGANQDAFAVGASMGVDAATAMNFSATGAGMQGTMRSMSASVARYASSGGDRTKAAFTTAERAAAKKK